MICPNCGAQNPDGSAYCIYCGMIRASGKNTASAADEQEEEARIPNPPPEPAAKSARSPSAIGIVIGAVWAAAAVFLVLVFTVISPVGIKFRSYSLAHVWNEVKNGYLALDLKTNKIYEQENNAPTENEKGELAWSLNGNVLTLETTIGSINEVNVYLCELSPDGRTLMLHANGGSAVPEGVNYSSPPVMVLVRAD